MRVWGVGRWFDWVVDRAWSCALLDPATIPQPSPTIDPQIKPAANKFLIWHHPPLREGKQLPLTSPSTTPLFDRVIELSFVEGVVEGALMASYRHPIACVAGEGADAKEILAIIES